MRTILLHLSLALTLALGPSGIFAEAALLQPSTASSPLERLRALEREIQRHDELYYLRGEPVISDSAYDALVDEVRALRDLYPQVADPGPGAGPTQPFREVPAAAEFPHLSPMRSLEKVASLQAALEWYASRAAELGVPEPDCLVEPKYDGVAVSVLYENGVLRRALSRGNGMEGLDITQSILRLAPVPRRLKESVPLPPLLEVRGELFATDDQFATNNELREEIGLEPYTHPRAMAAGLAHTDLVALGWTGRLSFVAFGVGELEGCPAEDLPALYGWLSAGGFSVPPYQMARSAADLAALLSQRSFATEGSVPTDGGVVKFASVPHWSHLGTSHEGPRAALAVKTEVPAVESTLLRVELQTTRAGRVVPIAVVEPVVVDGRRIERVHLFSGRNLDDLKLRQGAQVRIELRGGIIPHLVSAEIPSSSDSTAARGANLTMRSLLERAQIRAEGPDRSGHWAVSDVADTRVVVAAIDWFCGKKAMDIPGVGPALAQRMVDAGLLQSAIQLYELEASRLIEDVGLSAERAHALVSAIEASRSQSFTRLLLALSIPAVGPARAESIAEVFPTPRALASSTPAEWEALDHLPSSVTDAVQHWLDQRGGREILLTCAAHGVASAGAN